MGRYKNEKEILGNSVVFLFLLFGATAAWAPPPAPNPNLQERVAALEAFVATLQGQVGTLQGQVTILEGTVATLQGRVTTIDTTVADLEEKLEYMTVETGELEGLTGPHVIFEGVNVHVRSGSGLTDDNTDKEEFPEPGVGEDNVFTGLGNLIVGYNEDADEDAEAEYPIPQIREGSHKKWGTPFCFSVFCSMADRDSGLAGIQHW
jgi:TolA-binding protein